MNSSTRFAVAVASVAVLTACSPPRAKPLYTWESFPRQQYESLLTNGNPPLDQIPVMEAHAEKARAANSQLPPGFRAHLGLLKLSAGDADRARELWLAEKVAFPESAPYMDQLLKRMDGSTPSKKGKSA